MKILSKILNNKDIVNKEYLNTETSALEQRILALENDRRNGEVPIGTIIAYSSSTVPDGYLKCEGQAISRTDYSLLFAAIGTTYGAGDGSTTFNVPDLRGEFLRGAGTNSHQNQGSGETVGTHQDEELPNITGNLIFHGTNQATVLSSGSGVFSYYSKINANSYRSGGSNASGASSWFGAEFNASSSSSIYKDNGHVTPTNTSILYCIKYRSYNTSAITVDEIYPVGSIYMSANSTSPATLFGGTWTAIGQGRTLIGAGTGTDSNSISQTFNAGGTGGEYTHTLDLTEMPSHSHELYLRGIYNGTGQYTALHTTGDRAVSTGETGGDSNGNTVAHNNVQPYLVVYMWQRTA